MTTERELPPEIMSQFLDNIMKFETAYKSPNRILMYEFLGKPAYSKVEDLSDEEITVELSRLTGIMDKCQVCLDTICEVPERELYRFITEEFFLEDKEDVHIPGMISNFIYEDFHPNHEYDIRRISYDFICSYLDKDDDFYKYSLSTEAEKEEWHLHFRQAFSSFQLNKFSITRLNFDTEEANVEFECNFDAAVEGSTESLHFFGNGEIRLVYKWENWNIESVKLPKSI